MVDWLLIISRIIWYRCKSRGRQPNGRLLKCGLPFITLGNKRSAGPLHEVEMMMMMMMMTVCSSVVERRSLTGELSLACI